MYSYFDGVFLQEEKVFPAAYGFCGKKHNLTVLRALLNTPRGMGFNAIMKACPGLTPRMLSTRLKELEKLKLVSKGLVFGSPPRIEYKETAKAEGLKKILAELEEWGKKELS